MKIMVDAETRKILGAAILGPGGDEAIHGILNVMNASAVVMAGFTHQTALIAEPARQPRALVWKRAFPSAPMKL